VYESLGLKCLEMPLEHGIMGSQHFGMLLDFIFKGSGTLCGWAWQGVGQSMFILESEP
jgi:hypothetical protein